MNRPILQYALDLYGLVADLIERLVEYGCETDIIFRTLHYYGFTEEEIKEWYNIDYVWCKTNTKISQGETNE